MPYLVEQPFRVTEEWFKKNDSVVLGVGAIHSHDHIPQGIDTITCDYFMREIEKRTPILVVPTIPFGPMDNYMDYSGCISPQVDTFRDYVEQVTMDLFKWGARRIFIVNGHGGNTAPLLDVGYKLRKKGALMPIFEWWKLIQTIDPTLDKAVNALPESVTAGRKARTRGTETAAAMVLVPGSQKPETVKVVYSKEFFGGDMRTNFATGVNYKGTFVPLALGSRETTEWGEVGTKATKEMGDEILRKCLDYVVGFIETMKAHPVPSFRTD